MLEEILFLSEHPAPTGGENERAQSLLKLALGLGLGGFTDKLCNVVLRREGGGRRVLIAAPLDEPCMICCTADDKGFLRVRPVGVAKPELLPGRQVIFPGGVSGIIGAAQAQDKPAADDLFCDIGEPRREKALSICPPGSAGTFIYPLPEKRQGRIVGGGLSALAGAALLLRLVKSLKNGEDDLYLVFHAQRHTGYRGLQTAAFTCSADIAVLLETVEASDTPGAKDTSPPGLAVKLAQGSASYDRELSMRLLDTASSMGIEAFPYVSPDTVPGADAAQLAGTGCRMCSPALPVRYSGAFCESFFLSASDGILTLLREGLLK